MPTVLPCDCPGLCLHTHVCDVSEGQCLEIYVSAAIMYCGEVKVSSAAVFASPSVPGMKE